jgi:apolipoprotein N-acyltransferase
MRRRLALALSSGILLVLSFPLFSLWPLAFAALVPLYFALEGASTRRAFLLGWITGAVFFAGLLYWIVLNPAVEPWVRPLLYLGVALIAAYLALYLAAGLALARWLADRNGWPLWALAPLTLVLADYLRSHGLLAFPWGSLGYSLAGWVPSIQMAAFSGIYGVTFWALLANGLAFWLARRLYSRPSPARAALPACALLLALALPPLAGQSLLVRSEREMAQAPGVRVTLVQGNIAQGLRWDEAFREFNLQTYDSLSREAGRDSSALLVWPETAMPFYLRHQPEYFRRIASLADDIDRAILTGVPDMMPDPASGRQLFYNSAFLILPGRGLAASYAKSHLVPFGERFPYKDKIPFLRNVDFGEGEWTPGSDSVIFRTDQADFSCLICFESIFPEIARTQAGRGAQFLVNITNDGWFGRSGAARQHADMSVFRAVEQRRAIARCANSGISMFVMPSGRVLSRTGLFTQATIHSRIPLMNGSTFYQRHGDLFVLLLALLLGLTTLLPAVKRLRPANLAPTNKSEGE